MNAKDFLRIASFGAIIVASSCASAYNTGDGLMADPRANHPIMVEPDYRTIRLPFSVAEAGLMPDDNARFTDFVSGYLNRGSGSIAVSVAPTRDGDAAIRYFGERLAELGVPRDRILVGRREDAADVRVEINYVGYQARVAECGDWSTNWGDTASNRVTPNLGCSTQNNIAVMVADPRDLISPREMGDSDNRRRATVFDKYQKGETTSAAQTAAQSAAVSTVNSQ
jgi:pilus assembly protein CpaD